MKLIKIIFLPIVIIISLIIYKYSFNDKSDIQDTDFEISEKTLNVKPINKNKTKIQNNQNYKLRHKNPINNQPKKYYLNEIDQDLPFDDTSEKEKKTKKTNTSNKSFNTLRNEQKNNNNIFQSSIKSVVFIDSISRGIDLFSLSSYKVKSGSGTGIIWDNQGHVVTNYHVVANSREYFVSLSDNSQWSATYVGGSPHKDIAVLKLKAPKRKMIPIKKGNSNDLNIGDIVYSIGSPFGFDNTMTKGIISGLGREMQSMVGTKILDVIQTDCAINPGNSGGPLINIEGEAIGINTAIFSPSGANSGVSFAVPIDIIKSIVPKIISTNGDIKRAGLGIVRLEPYANRFIGIEGVIVNYVQQNSGAAIGGIKPITQVGPDSLNMDVITKIDGKVIKTFSDLERELYEKQVGDQVNILINRITINSRYKKINSSVIETKIELGELKIKK